MFRREMLNTAGERGKIARRKAETPLPYTPTQCNLLTPHARVHAGHANTLHHTSLHWVFYQPQTGRHPCNSHFPLRFGMHDVVVMWSIKMIAAALR
jgi:hypothetical protein